MKIISIILLSACFTLPVLADTVVVNQPAGTFLGSESDNSPPNFQHAYDDFTLSFAHSLDQLQWTGSKNPAATLSGFDIAIYSSFEFQPDDEQPFKLLYSKHVNGDANETSLGADPNISALDRFSYQTDISFQAAANTEYWLTIQGNVPSPFGWIWTSGNGGDLRDILTTPGNSNEALRGDLAFTIIEATSGGNTPPAVTPEPSSLVLLGSGVLTIAGMVRKRLRKQ